MNLLPDQLKGIQGYKNFVYLVWKKIGLPDPTPIQYDIAEWIAGGPRRRAVEGFRGVAKSYLVAAYIVWRGLEDPDIKVMLLSASKQRSDNLSMFIRQIIIIMGDLTRPLMPGPDKRDSWTAFDFGACKDASGSPSVVSRGVTSSNTGSRADIIVCDDVCSWANTQTQVMRDKLRSTIKELDGAILSVGGEALYLYTMQTEDDPMKDLEERGFEVRLWPARVPDNDWLLHYGHKLAPYVRKMIDTGEDPGTPTDPLRFNEEELQERERTYGRTMFGLQFMLDSRMADSDRYPLKINDLIVAGLDPSHAYEKYAWSGGDEYGYPMTELQCWGFPGDLWRKPMAVAGDFIEYQGTILAVDTSGAGQDEQVTSVVSALNGTLFLHEQIIASKGYAPEALKAIANAAYRYKANLIIYEENFGDGMFGELLAPVVNKIRPCTIEPVRVNMQKERRICDVLEPLMNSHKLVVGQACVHKDLQSVERYPPEQQRSRSLAYQLSHITRQRAALAYDDRVDSLAIACAHWIKSIGLDADAEMAHRQEILEDQMFEEFLESAGLVSGHRSRNHNWKPQRK